MNSRTRNFLNASKSLQVFTSLLGALLLIGTWFSMYQLETLFAESHLASYYCCLMPQELQKLGALERVVSDFFRTSPGRDLPAVLLVSANLAIFISAVRKAPKATWLPLVFVLFNFLYVITDLATVSLSWSISNGIVGPQLTPYKGYHRTWYGIVLHLALWGAFLLTVAKSSRIVTALQRSMNSTV